MRRYRENRSRTISCFAIAGTHAVLLGMNATEEGRKGLLGFSIQRQRRITGGRSKGKWSEPRYLTGWLTFKETAPADYLEPSYFRQKHAKGSAEWWHNRMSRPIQDFQWGDYSARPGVEYRYKVFPKYGTPKAGQDPAAGPPVIVDVQTESVDDERDIHDVYFNRGVVASQAFERRFPEINDDSIKPKRRVRRGETPAEVKLEEALAEPDSEIRRWLSRGLEEALLAFIGRARDRDWGLRGCLYEFSYEPVLLAIKAASERGADVHMLYEGKQSGGKPNETAEKNIRTVRKLGMERITTPRNARGISISHNKFLILLHKGEPVAVWTGSTNITEGGILGHSNVGHSVRDPIVAGHFLKTWNKLHETANDPGYSASHLRPWHDENSPVNPGGEPDHGTRVVFSPRGYSDKSPCPYEALNYYASALNGAQHGVFLTAAFGVSEEFTEMLERKRDFLRYVLLDNPGQAARRGSRKKGSIDRTAQILKDERNRVAIGSFVPENALEGWHEEHVSPINNHVRYVHTKYMLIDPLSDFPTVITGSANFSRSSTFSNDENMLVIEGNTRVADIYLTEFMRLWTTFYFRDHLTGALDAARKARSVRNWDITKRYQDVSPKKRYLKSDDSWTEKYYVEGSVRQKERLYFSGLGRKGKANRAVGAVRPRRVVRQD